MGTFSHPDLVDFDEHPIEYRRKACPLIYLDNNATTMLDDEVVSAMTEHLKHCHLYGNPSSKHLLGDNARRLMEESRETIRRSINGRPSDQLIFTSGGTESNNLAIRGILSAHSDQMQHVITSPFEHPAVEQVLRSLQKTNPKIRLSVVRVDEQGRIDLEHFQQLFTDETKFVTVMHSNNEIGTIQPIRELVRLCRAYSPSIVVHSDASQSMGKVVVDVQELDVDLLTICSHKYHGPKGIAVLYRRHGIELCPLMGGGGQEEGARPGTENLLAIVGLAKASEPIVNSLRLKERIERMRRARDRLQHGLMQRWKEDFPLASSLPLRNGSDENGLANTLSVSYPNLQGKVLVERLKGQVAFSTGSACHEQHEGDESLRSSTLQSIGLSGQLAEGTIRLSTCWTSTDEQIDRAIELIGDAIREQLQH